MNNVIFQIQNAITAMAESGTSAAKEIAALEK